MAKKSIDLDKTETNSFIKGLNKDSDSSFIQEGMWTHARNIVNNTVEGNLGTISGEPANYLCATAGETLPGVRKVIIGAIHLYSPQNRERIYFVGIRKDVQKKDFVKPKEVKMKPLSSIVDASLRNETCSIRQNLLNKIRFNDKATYNIINMAFLHWNNHCLEDISPT